MISCKSSYLLNTFPGWYFHLHIVHTYYFTYSRVLFHLLLHTISLSMRRKSTASILLPAHAWLNLFFIRSLPHSSVALGPGIKCSCLPIRLRRSSDGWGLSPNSTKYLERTTCPTCRRISVKKSMTANWCYLRTRSPPVYMVSGSPPLALPSNRVRHAECSYAVFSLSDKDRILIGTEDGLHVVETGKDGKFTISAILYGW